MAEDLQSELIIRPIELRDAAQMRDNLHSRNTSEETRQIVADSLEKALRGEVAHIVAELGGQIVGTAMVVRNPHPLRRHRAELTGLVVKHDLWRRGIARRLVEACRVRAREMGIEILETSCRGGEPAEKIYPRLGFEVYARLPRGLVESWEGHREFDEVYFWMRV